MGAAVGKGVIPGDYLDPQPMYTESSRLFR